MNPACINLKKQFGRRHRVEYEESYFAEYGSKVYREVPELMVLLCRYGDVFPQPAAHVPDRYEN